MMYITKQYGYGLCKGIPWNEYQPKTTLKSYKNTIVSTILNWSTSSFWWRYCWFNGGWFTHDQISRSSIIKTNPRSKRRICQIPPEKKRQLVIQRFARFFSSQVPTEKIQHLHLQKKIRWFFFVPVSGSPHLLFALLGGNARRIPEVITERTSRSGDDFLRWAQGAQRTIRVEGPIAPSFSSKAVLEEHAWDATRRWTRGCLFFFGKKKHWP